MAQLILDSLHIKNFRAFQQLKIEHLGQVNLIVGKNNIGKTNLLEALRLYASRSVPEVIWDLLNRRDESLLREVYSTKQSKIEGRLQALKYLFYGRKAISNYPETALPEPIELGPLDSPNKTLSLAVEWYKEIYDLNSSTLMLRPLLSSEISLVQSPIPVLVVRMGSSSQMAYRLNEENKALLKAVVDPIHHIFLSPSHVSKLEISHFWDEAILSNLDDRVIEALSLIAPIKRVTIINRWNKDQEPEKQRMMVRLAGQNDFIPLSSLGEGTIRLFELALATVNAQNGMLLIDDVESGFHYSLQSELWRLIFELAERLNIQVFATTHSWECIEAFQQVACKQSVEGLLLNLRHKRGKPGEVAAILYDEQRLGIATSQQIEVR